MKLSGTERETIVLYNEAEAAASIYTHNAALCRQLSEPCWPVTMPLPRPLSPANSV